jgi:hypothetical protein
MKKTAVDWAFEQLDEHVFRIDHVERRLKILISFEDMMTLKKEAKEMEKEQSIDFARLCLNKAKDLDVLTAFINAQQYYNETYKQL